MSETPQDREHACACCRKTFRARAFRGQHVLSIALPDPMSIPIDFEGIWQYPKFCPKCRELIKKVEWFKHHRKDPTPELLQKDLRKKIRELEQLKEKGKFEFGVKQA